MRVRSRWLTGLLCLGVACSASRAPADDRNAASPVGPRVSASLKNGVTISPKCDQGTSPVQHIVFSGTASHKFLGYGVSIEGGTAAFQSARTVAVLRQLGFVWVKIALVRPGQTPGATTGPSGAAFDAAIQAQVNAGLPDANRKLYDALRSAGIKIVDTIHVPNGAYFSSVTTNKGKLGRRIVPDAIPGLAKYYASYLRALTAAGIRPDLIEPINEPNLGMKGRFDADEYAEFVKDLETDLGMPSGSPPSGIALSGPATATHVPIALDFVHAMDARGALSALKAITLHTYYIRDQPVNSGIPPADDPALRTLAATAKRLGIPLISTEFGGTDLKTKNSDPSRESVDAAEEMKAALDLIREGESVAIVWDLYPNMKDGNSINTWALVDKNGPTNAYWPFYILSRRVPVGSDVLAVERSDIVPTMTSLGYAAFRSGRRLFIGLSNADAQTATTVDLDLSRLGSYSVTHAASFGPTRAVDLDTSIFGGQCHLAVTIPGGTGTVVDIALSQ
jgi:hypothetical protein